MPVPADDAWPVERLATYADMEALPAASADPGAGGPVGIDARGADRFRGEVEPIDARPGHIPGNRNLPWAGLVDPDTKRFREVEELRARFAEVGIGPGTDVIASCGSGVSACADLIALEAAGLGPGRLFVPSWSGWAADPDRPAGIGPT